MIDAIRKSFSGSSSTIALTLCPLSFLLLTIIMLQTRSFGGRTMMTMMAGEKKYTIVIVRHGESTWNDENRFTGWYDCPLSAKGLQEAKEAGKILKVGW